jgi:hypothetical protein
MKSKVGVKRLPSNVLAGATSMDLAGSRRFGKKISSDCVSQGLGVRRINESCLEVHSGARLIKSAHGSAIGAFFVVGVFISIFISLIIQRPYPVDVFLILLFLPILLSAIGLAFYLSARNSGDGHVRISRKTGKIYYVIPGEWRLVTLEWQEIQPMVANLHVGGGLSGGTVLNPLFLVGVDWTQSPPREASVSCGNLGWRDSGESAHQLLSYIQHFMDFGLEGLPMPDPLPPPASRRETFLYGYQQWAKKFREDLSTPNGKRWAVLWAPAKVFWLITMVFPESIGAYLDYTVPEIKFSAEIDALCGFE